MNSILIHSNDIINISHDACRLCYKSKGRDTVEGKLKYIEDKIRVGHESILEHTNLIMLVFIKQDMYKDLVEFQAAGPELKYTVREQRDRVCIIISGSVRAFKNVYRNIKNGNNGVLNLVTQKLYDTPKEFYYDFIKAGIMHPRSFIDPINTIGYNNMYFRDEENIYYDIVNVDNIESIMNKIDDFVGGDLFEYDDLLKHISITIYFKRISRIISHQMTRHRNAISQKSQRYVGEEDVEFIHPNEFTSIFDEEKDRDEYLSTHDGVGGYVSFDRVCNNNLKVYKDMRDNGFTKEDARYYLTQNANTELYITFSGYNLIHFIMLRKEPVAQAEIRNLALLLLDDMSRIWEDTLGDDLSIYLIPKYQLMDNNYRVEGIDGSEEIEDVYDDGNDTVPVIEKEYEEYDGGEV